MRKHANSLTPVMPTKQQYGATLLSFDLSAPNHLHCHEIANLTTSLQSCLYQVNKVIGLMSMSLQHCQQLHVCVKSTISLHSEKQGVATVLATVDGVIEFTGLRFSNVCLFASTP